MHRKYVPGVILDKRTIGPVSTQKTGFYCSTAGGGISGLGPPPGDSRAQERSGRTFKGTNQFKKIPVTSA